MIPRSFARPCAGRRWLGAVLFILLGAPTPAIPADQVTVTDATGTAVTVTQPVQRVISLAPSLTDTVFELGAERQLIGAIAHDTHPPGAEHILSVGTVASLNFERIVQLKPQLILAWEGGTPGAWISRLRALKLPVYVSRTRTLAQVGSTLRDIGRLTGVSGERIASRYDALLAALRQRYANLPVVSVFYQVWADPLMTLNGQHIISDAIGTCGGRNVFADAPSLVPHVNIEAVLAAGPQVIATSVSSNDPGPGSGDSLDRWKTLPGLPAAENNHFVVLDADQVSRPTTRMLQAVETLCQGIDKARQ